MSKPMLRIRAVAGDHPLIDPDTGSHMHGRRAGRDRDGAPLADGEWVHDHVDYRRALACGSLELLEETSAEESSKRSLAPPTGAPIDAAKGAEAMRFAAMRRMTGGE